MASLERRIQQLEDLYQASGEGFPSEAEKAEAERAEGQRLLIIKVFDEFAALRASLADYGHRWRPKPENDLALLLGPASLCTHDEVWDLAVERVWRREGLPEDKLEAWRDGFREYLAGMDEERERRGVS